MTQITDHLGEIEGRIADALRRSRSPSRDVTIVAATKQQSPETIGAAHRAGLRDFGESYLQEALPKLDALAGVDARWHFIGSIQANKTRTIAERFDCIHTLDRARIADRLNAQRPAHAARLDVFIQVNLAAEPQKGGVAPAEVGALADRVAGLPRLALRGLMTVPPNAPSAEASRPYFIALRDLLEALRRGGHEADALSMGMSGDFTVAVEEGATHVRIGTALFGARPNRGS